MSQIPGLFLAQQLSGLRLGNQPIQLVDDGYCVNCGGHGHWEESCNLFEQTKLSGRPITSIARAPGPGLHFNTSLPWLELRFNQNLRSYSTDPQNITNHGDMINLMLDFMGHFSNYATFRREQSRLLHDMGHWLYVFLMNRASNISVDDTAAGINHVRTSNDIMIAWKALEEESIDSILELVSSIVETVRDFERIEIITPIASDLSKAQRLPTVNQVQYSDIWDHLCSARPESFLSAPLDPRCFRALLAKLTSHRSRYTTRQVKMETVSRAAMSCHQMLREDPRATTACLMPKLVSIELKDVTVASLSWDDFEWPNKESIAFRWASAMNDPEVRPATRGDLDVTSVFDRLSL